MNMYSIKLPLRAVFKSSSLVTRHAARRLVQKVDELDVEKVILDFSNIDYASRSFFNEFVHEINQVHNKQVDLDNLSPDLKELYDFVINFRREVSSIEKID